MSVRIQHEDFDVSREIAALRAGKPQIGAIASFVGVVRDLNDGDKVAGMTLEHYPGMTERALSAIADKAEGKFTVKDKPTAADLSLAQAVYDALPTKVKDALAPLADVSLSRAIVLADELADAGTIDDPEPMTAFLFLLGQIIETGEEA